MRNLLAVGIVVAVVGGSLWWLLHDDALAPPPADSPAPAAALAAPAPTAAPVAAPVAATPAAAVATEAVATTERTAAPPPAEAKPEHTLRGRAVDAAGQPLAGVEAGLLGWTGNSQRLAAWTKDNAEPARIERKVVTGPDGVFTFRCWPPPPFQFLLRLQGNAVATWSQRWNEWPPGGTTDLGDVKLEPGTLLRGRVVDSAGAPVGKVEVRVNAATRQRARDGAAETWCTARTGDDGAFVQRWALPAGEYTIGIDDQQVDRGAKVTLTGEPEQSLEIVLKRIDAKESISGVVVDETGAPVRSVMIHAQASRSGRSISTDEQGRFRVLKHDDAPAEITISVTARGFEAPAEPVAAKWGTHDLRIVVTRGKELVVLVIGTDDRPVEEYVLRVIPIGGGFNSMDHEPRGKPPHAEGRAVVRGIGRGKHRVVVQPRGTAFAIGVVPIEVGANGAPPVTVRLAATHPRTVRVVAAGGAPIARAVVQLVDPCGEPWDAKTHVHSFSGSTFSSGPQALELAVATTDGSGECSLPVPGDRPLALMLPGPGHVPLAVQPAVFPPDAPLVVTVSAGATLRGKIGPEAAWAELLRLGGAEGKVRPTELPSVSLQRGEGRSTERFPDRSRHAVNADGSFELSGAPPGRWNVFVDYFARQTSGGAYGKQESVGTVDLVDGEVATIAPDVSAILPGTLEALVQHDGAPLAKTLVSFERLVPGAPWPTQEAAETTDAEGRVRASLRGGEYRVAWNVSRPDRSFGSTLRAIETAVVRAGATTRCTFTIVSGTLRVRLVDSAGAPVANVHVGLIDAAGADTEGLGSTNADGRIEKRHMPGTYTAVVMPKRLHDQKALMEFYRSATNDPAAMQRARVTLGTITVTAGGVTEQELRLPADW